MKKKANLEALSIKSFITTENKIGGNPMIIDDGTVMACHCPTLKCNPSIEWPTNCCY